MANAPSPNTVRAALRRQVLQNRARLIAFESVVDRAARAGLNAIYARWEAELRRLPLRGGGLSKSALATASRRADLLRRMDRLTASEFAAIKSKLAGVAAEVYKRESLRARYMLAGRITESGASIGASFRGVSERAAAAALRSDLPVAGWLKESKVPSRVRAAMRRDVANAVADDWSIDKLAKALRAQAGRLLAREASILARTAVMQAASNAAAAVYAKSGAVEALQWEATFDARTCLECASLHGQVFEFDKAPPQPAHPGCRCTWLPVLRDVGAQKLGRLRAFRNQAGGTSFKQADRSFGEYLRKLPPGEQRDFFPSELKLQLWRGRVVPLEDMLRADGSTRSDAELRAWPKVQQWLASKASNPKG